MTELDGIVDQLRRAVEGDSWQGSSIRELLDGVSAASAAAHPIEGAHSIWELLLHVTVWVRAVHARVGGQVCEPEGDDDWPPVRDTSEKAWAAALADLRRAQAELLATLETMSDVDLGGAVPNREYDRAHMLHGLTQHHAYHAGQMAILKRALECRSPGADRLM